MKNVHQMVPHRLSESPAIGLQAGWCVSLYELREALAQQLRTQAGFVLSSYANVVFPLKPVVGPSMFGRGVAQPG
jgi:hypothetical protein